MAQNRDSERDIVAFLGGEVVRARKAAGFPGQEQFAHTLQIHRTGLNRIESGARPPTPDQAAALDRALPQFGGLFVRLSALARNAEGPVPRWFADWLEAEREAQSLWIWQPTLIPGLAQTAEYARALFLAEKGDIGEEALDALVKARLDRQMIFDGANPPDTVIVLDEAVLHRLIGSPEIMRDTLGRLVGLSRRTYVVVQVVPASSGGNAGLGGAFDIASGADRDILRMEGVEDQITGTIPLIRKARVTFNRVRADALSRGDSRELILRVSEEKWNKQTD